MKIEHLVMPETLEEAINLLQENARNRLVGGGAWMRLGSQSYDTLIALDNLSLNYIVTHQDYVDIGAMTTLRDIEVSNTIQSLQGGILSEAVSVIMGLQIRNIATIGGSVAGKYSFSDILPVLLAMNATVLLYPDKQMSLAEYIQTKHLDKHIITAIRLPKVNGSGYFKKVSKTLLDFSILNLAITKTDRTRIYIGARPGVAMEASKAGVFLTNQKTWSDDTVQKAVSIALTEISVSSNNRAEQAYREDLLETYLRRGLQEVM